MNKNNNSIFGDYLNPYLIAEIGVNHECSLKLAKKQIKLAKDGGASAVKFQFYKASKIAAKISPAYWDTNYEKSMSQFELFSSYDKFVLNDYIELVNYCSKLEIDFLCTPFDLDAVDFVAKYCKFIKISSSDITNFPLLKKCSLSKLPIILSTGASSYDEISDAVDYLFQYGSVDICLLHCVLNYPTPIENARLSSICDLLSKFPKCSIGYSDHVTPTNFMASLEVAVLLGSVVLEKHFTHDKTLPGNDHYHSMDHDDLTKFTNKLATYRKLFASNNNFLQKEESARLNARRSIYAHRDIQPGESITEDALICLRPATGISPIHFDKLIGMVAIKKISAGDKLHFNQLTSSI